MNYLQFSFFIKKIIILLFLILNINIVKGQLIVNTGQSAANLVQNVLVGNGVTVSNVTFNGSANALGEFSNGNSTNLGITNGIILSTGYANEAAGQVSFTPSTSFVLGGDPQLQNLITQTVYDAAVLQFDFIPIADTLKFKYVFGSDEYPEYVNNYNDVFGFFITGPNPLGGVYSNKNIALIPGTTLPVTINNVNNVNPSYPQYYIDNESINGATITYDGFTTVLTAWVLVEPCMQYHIKIAIGDAGDHVLDSGVFLEANSFSSNAVNFTTSYTSNVDPDAVEGCNDAIITFNIPTSSPNDQSIHFTISGTAVNGTDYLHIADSIVIPAGQTSANITISPINDGNTEPTESVFLIFQSSPCGNDTVKIFIKDYNVLTGSFDNPVICGTGADILDFNSAYGFPPITYQWNTGETTSSINTSTNVSTNYIITATDACGTSITDSVFVDIIDATLSKNDILCFGQQNGNATVNVNIGTAPYNYNWNTTPQQNGVTATGLAAGDYSVTITDAHNCSLEIPFSITQPPQLALNLMSQDETCLNSCNGQAYANVSGGILPYSFVWSSNPQHTTDSAINICNGNYTVTITDSNNCEISQDFTILTNTLITADFIASASEGVVPLNVDFVYTGIGASTWQWDFGDGNTSSDQNPSNTFTEMGIFNVVLTVNSGAPDSCTHSYSMLLETLLPSNVEIPNVFTPNGDGTNDLFYVENKGLKSACMKIFNRWGKLIANWENAQGSWDGNINGNPASSGTYYYIFTAQGFDDVDYNINGTIELIR